MLPLEAVYGVVAQALPRIVMDNATKANLSSSPRHGEETLPSAAATERNVVVASSLSAARLRTSLLPLKDVTGQDGERFRITQQGMKLIPSQWRLV